MKIFHSVLFWGLILAAGVLSSRVLVAAPGTAWTHRGGQLTQHFAWDMGEPVTLSALSVHSTIRDATGRINAFTLHVSDDGKLWRKIHEGNLESTPGAVRIPFAKPVTARYFKLEATSLHAGADMVITDLEGLAL